MTTHQLNSIHDDPGGVIRQITSGDPILLSCDGTSLGALVSVEDLRLLEHYIDELEDRIDLEEATKSLEEVERDGPVPCAVVRKELGLCISSH